MSPERARAENAHATLRDAYLSHDAHGEFLTGLIYGDSMKRYQDGEEFRTSYVRAIDADKNVFDSRTGVQYTVESWRQNFND